VLTQERKRWKKFWTAKKLGLVKFVAFDLVGALFG
jgi:hypothetical protein